MGMFLNQMSFVEKITSIIFFNWTLKLSTWSFLMKQQTLHSVQRFMIIVHPYSFYNFFLLLLFSYFLFVNFVKLLIKLKIDVVFSELS